MSITSGRLTFCRFAVTGDAPTTVDDTALSILKEYAFLETQIGAPDEVEAGFVTGEHLLDTRFSYEKNGYGDAMLFAVRIDTHKVPPDLKQAYRKINEQAAAGGNPSGFASKADKRDAHEAAERTLRDELAAGKFRRSKMVQVLWDLQAKEIYCATTSYAVLEQVAKLFKSAFAVNLDYQSAGTSAGRILRGQGRGRDYEDLKPAPFTSPPAGATQDHEDADGARDMKTPLVPWVTKSVDLKDFLGNEFLIWIWWICETNDGAVEGVDEDIFIAIDKALDMDCAWDVDGKQTLRGGAPTKMAEAGDALRLGKWPRKAGLILSDGLHQWEMTLQGDQWQVAAALLPPYEDAAGPRELIEHRIDMTRRLVVAIDILYGWFLTSRVVANWPATRLDITRWINKRK